VDSLRARLRAMDPQLKLFVGGMVCLGIAAGIFETTFNNYLDYTFGIHADVRGFLEFPRELPGFLTALLAGLLFFLPETRIAAAACLAVGAGMIGLALGGSAWGLMLAFTVLWSTGSHLMMPINSSLAIHLAHEDARGRRLGQISAVGTAASILGCLVVWGLMRQAATNYALTFAIGGGVAVIGALVFARMHLPTAHLVRPKFVWNRRYWLYYVLAFLFGARKQIFITFGPWVLIRVFKQQPAIFAQLWIVAALLGILFHPWLGRVIDRYGERVVLMADSVLIFLICAGYGFSHRIESQEAALGLLYACFVMDQLLFGVNMARTTYLSKIAVRSEDVAPTLSLGITINHAVSMSMPALGGLLWMKYGHTAVFQAAAVVAVFMLAFSACVRVPQPAD